MSDPFDPASLALPPGSIPVAKQSKRLPRHRGKELFLKGPIPWNWIEAAASLPGKTLAVGLALWQESGFRRNREVAITLNRLARLSMDPQTARRAIRQLEAAELIAISRSPGRVLWVRLLRVRLLDAPAKVTA